MTVDTAARRAALLTIEQAAERIGRSVQTLRHWRMNGEGPPAFRMGRRVMYAADDLERWVADQRRAAFPVR